MQHLSRRCQLWHLERYIQTHRSAGVDALAADVRHMGQVEVFGSVPAGMAIVGLAAHRPGLVRGSFAVRDKR